MKKDVNLMSVHIISNSVRARVITSIKEIGSEIWWEGGVFGEE